MKVFNAFQLVLFFACAPFAVSYVRDAEFYGHHVLFWTLIVAYLVGFIGMCGAVYYALEDK